MFRRAPGRIQAENFGAQGAEKSFHLKDVSKRASLYRTSEPVDIDQIESGPRNQEFAIRLQPDEWTAYSVSVRQPGTYELSVRAKALTVPGSLRISAGGQSHSLAVAGGDYSHLQVGKVRLEQGTARLLVTASRAEVGLDWLELSGPESAPD